MLMLFYWPGKSDLEAGLCVMGGLIRILAKVLGSYQHGTDGVYLGIHLPLLG